ncbi:MAG: N-acetyltransferase [Gammaproteobacteria bacterium]|nr:MAG: N-acetyltransferase [Gammaproteobacteria bacterium]
MHPIKVRAETADDFRAIDVVNLSAFEGEAEAQLVSELRKSSGFIPDLSLVAELNGRIVGHVVLSRVQLHSSSGDTEVLALGPMSVVPSQSHRGIGSELIVAAVARAKPLCYSAIVVAGHPDYYLRFGFKPAKAWGVSANLSIPDDALTAMELVEGTLSGGGEIEYPGLFKALF